MTTTDTAAHYSVRLTLTTGAAATLIADLARTISRGEHAELTITTGPANAADFAAGIPLAPNVARIACSGRITATVATLVHVGHDLGDGWVVPYNIGQQA
jgi:hypothetical protein